MDFFIPNKNQRQKSVFYFRAESNIKTYQKLKIAIFSPILTNQDLF